jgi:NADH-quinone oxidoreductase subunit H
MSDFNVQLLATLVKIAVIAGALQGSVAFMTWVERRVSGWIQDRKGPNRVGPFGLLQPIADGLKFILKEDIIPPGVHKPLYVLAPALALVPALTAFCVIPFGTALIIAGHRIPLVVADVDPGVLVALAISSMGVYGIAMAGWASNNKYSQMGGLRSSAQLISYELALGLAVVGVVMGAGSLRPTEIVAQQGAWAWNCFLQPIGCLVFIIAAFAETNRAPFDLPEAESELVAGYHTEYSAMKFAMFFMSEYINMAVSAGLMVTLFFGGWNLPGLDRLLTGNALALAQVGVFVAKIACLMFFFVWVRWTLPRFRYDQLMRIGWKTLLPLAFLQIAVTGALVASGLYDKVQP